MCIRRGLTAISGALGLSAGVALAFVFQATAAQAQSPTLEQLLSGDVWATFDTVGNALDQGIAGAAVTYGIDLVINRVGTMSGMYFLGQSPENWGEVRRANQDHFVTFFHAMLEQGVFFAPSSFEAAFISTVHDQAIVDFTVNAASVAFRRIAEATQT